MQQAPKNMDSEMQLIVNKMLNGIAMSYGIPTDNHEHMMRSLEAKKREETNSKKKRLLELATDQLAGLERAKDIQNVMLMMAGAAAWE